jgi:hypothetical protein
MAEVDIHCEPTWIEPVNGIEGNMLVLSLSLREESDVFARFEDETAHEDRG